MGKMAFIEAIHRGLKLILQEGTVTVTFLYTPAMESLRQINAFYLTVAARD